MRNVCAYASVVVTDDNFRLGIENMIENVHMPVLLQQMTISGSCDREHDISLCSGSMVGAKTTDYLLEKSRIVVQVMKNSI